MTATTTQYIFADADVESITVSTNASVEVGVSSAAQWSTCILPFSHSVPSGVTAYTCTSKITEGGDDYLVLSPAATMDAYTPYVLFSESGWTGTLTGTVDAAQYPGTGYVTAGYLNGAIQAQQTSSGYVLQKQDGGVKFYNMNGQIFSIPAGKCWVTVSADCKAFGMHIAGSTDIKRMTAGNEQRTEVVYDLQGRKTTKDKAQKGLYIENGRKVLNLK